MSDPTFLRLWTMISPSQCGRRSQDPTGSVAPSSAQDLDTAGTTASEGEATDYGGTEARDRASVGGCDGTRSGQRRRRRSRVLLRFESESVGRSGAIDLGGAVARGIAKSPPSPTSVTIDPPDRPTTGRSTESEASRSARADGG